MGISKISMLRQPSAIASYFNLDRDTDLWRRWIALRGPILAAVWVDTAWIGRGPTAGA